MHCVINDPDCLAQPERIFACAIIVLWCSLTLSSVSMYSYKSKTPFQKHHALQFDVLLTQRTLCQLTLIMGPFYLQIAFSVGTLGVK